MSSCVALLHNYAPLHFNTKLGYFWLKCHLGSGVTEKESKNIPFPQPSGADSLVNLSAAGAVKSQRGTEHGWWPTCRSSEEGVQ